MAFCSFCPRKVRAKCIDNPYDKGSNPKSNRRSLFVPFEEARGGCVKEGDDAIVEDVDEDGVEELQAVEETKNNKVRR